MVALFFLLKPTFFSTYKTFHISWNHPTLSSDVAEFFRNGSWFMAPLTPLAHKGMFMWTNSKHQPAEVTLNGGLVRNFPQIPLTRV